MVRVAVVAIATMAAFLVQMHADAGGCGGCGGCGNLLYGDKRIWRPAGRIEEGLVTGFVELILSFSAALRTETRAGRVVMATILALVKPGTR